MERDDSQPDETPMDDIEALRPYLLRVAHRVLAGRDGAEDVVQEAFGRLMRADRDSISDERGWLAVVVRNLAIDRTRSAHARHEIAGAGVMLAATSGADPADRVTLDDQVQQALAVVLDRLSPPERTAFVLHDVFGFEFAEVARIVGRTPAACRQLASRARRSIRSDDHLSDAMPPTSAGSTTSLVAERFIAACAGGDIADLMAVLDPDVVGHAAVFDRPPFSESVGRVAVSTRLLQLFGPQTNARMVAVSIEDREGIIVINRGRVRAVMIVEARNDRIHHIESFVKLGGPIAR